LPWPSEGARRHAAEVADARHRDADEAVEDSYMRVPRSVTLAPIGSPARSLKDAFALRDLVISGILPGDLGEIGERRVHHFLVR